MNGKVTCEILCLRLLTITLPFARQDGPHSDALAQIYAASVASVCGWPINTEMKQHLTKYSSNVVCSHA